MSHSLDKTEALPPLALKRDAAEPLYRQLSSLIEEQIKARVLRVGDRLESEFTLAERYGVSRITVRQAIGDLVQRRLLVRKQGKGTFVSQPAVRHDLRRLHGLLGSLLTQSDEARGELLRYELAVPPAEVQRAMSLRPGQPALALTRRYLIDARPAMLGEDWLVAEAANVPRATANLISSEDILHKIGVRIDFTETSIRAEPVGAAAARLLGVASRSPVLVLRRTAFSPEGEVKEYGRLSFCSDSYEFFFSTKEPGAGGSPLAIRNVSQHE